MSQLSLGIIDYLNCQPINWRIGERLPGVRLFHGVPTALNQALIDGRLAIAPISAYEYARHADDLLVVPGLSIATLGVDGPDASIAAAVGGAAAGSLCGLVLTTFRR